MGEPAPAATNRRNSSSSAHRTARFPLALSRAPSRRTCVGPADSRPTQQPSSQLVPTCKIRNSQVIQTHRIAKIPAPIVLIRQFRPRRSSVSVSGQNPLRFLLYQLYVYCIKQKILDSQGIVSQIANCINCINCIMYITSPNGKEEKKSLLNVRFGRENPKGRYNRYNRYSWSP